MTDPFSSRPQRHEVCSRCGGSGTIHKGYALAATLQRIKGAPKGALHALPVGSVSINEATQEASNLAKKWKLSIAFEFNNILVVVSPKSDPIKIMRAWWKKAYNCTPEESLANR